MVDAALNPNAEPAVVLTYAWDRLLIDPVPGPRGPANFTGLKALTPTVSAVPRDARPVAPAGSTLPRLAAELPHTFALIDPNSGVRGITQQLQELTEHLAPDAIELLDVGGDILAKGDEPTLRSPLGDALTLAACCQLSVPVRLLIAGPGLDGELPADQLRERLGPKLLSLTAEHTKPVSGVLEWHPSEATAMLAATARGARGLCEVRDSGLSVPLTDEGPTLHQADLDDALSRNELARAILSTTSLEEAEQYSREICGYSEIDYERNKAAWLDNRTAEPIENTAALLTQLDQFEAEASARGATHTTFRRITEALGYDGSQRLQLRELLLQHRPEQYDAPLWHITSKPA
ncbi:DUF1152 domain-containing protein [Streptomyces sp. NBC_01186]|uniref:DUF1152 domain-containing protein n=1 Tax=Streptomyces sp. NBC_01186 TaxID=2903765 RepID=UPI003FA72F80